MTSTPVPAATSAVLEIDTGSSVPVTVDLGTANEYGAFDETGYEGNLYLRINGRLYGSLYVRYDADAAHPTISLGQYDPATQQVGAAQRDRPRGIRPWPQVVGPTDPPVNR